jgi:ketosteroid isomerase-like protein
MSYKNTLDGLFHAIDKMDADQFASYLSEDCRFKFGNWDAVFGRHAAHASVARFFESIRSLAHDSIDIYESGDAVTSRGMVTYTRHSGTTLTIPFCNVFRMEGNQIRDYQIYADVSTLYVEPAAIE